jgi:hypothetical protein
MSETVTEQLVSDAETQPSTETASTETAQTEVSSAEGSETQSTEQTEPKPEPKPRRTDRHVANLTARVAAEAQAREAAERRAEAAEALLRAGQQQPADQPPPQSRTDPVDVETRAAQLIQEREFSRRLAEIDAAGKKEIGADAWEQAKATHTGLGAVSNQAFLAALAETENPAKIFTALADDTDALVDLLNKSPAAMAARLGRMDAEISRPAVKPLSAAPVPAPRVHGGAIVPEPDPYNYPKGMGMKEWNAMMDKILPPSLGGKAKRT